MGKTAIAYYSSHHGNTKKILDALKEADPDLVLIDVTKRREADLTVFDTVGFASGIYYLKYAEQVLNFARVNLHPYTNVFFIATAGNPTGGIFNAISDITKEKHCTELGRFACPGFDTFGPLRLVGGIQKGHPNENELKQAVEFYQELYSEQKKR